MPPPISELITLVNCVCRSPSSDNTSKISMPHLRQKAHINIAALGKQRAMRTKEIILTRRSSCRVQTAAPTPSTQYPAQIEPTVSERIWTEDKPAFHKVAQEIIAPCVAQKNPAPRKTSGLGEMTCVIVRSLVWHTTDFGLD